MIVFKMNTGDIAMWNGKIGDSNTIISSRCKVEIVKIMVSSIKIRKLCTNKYWYVSPETLSEL